MSVSSDPVLQLGISGGRNPQLLCRENVKTTHDCIISLVETRILYQVNVIKVKRNTVFRCTLVCSVVANPRYYDSDIKTNIIFRGHSVPST
jgi:hypothetical protein